MPTYALLNNVDHADLEINPKLGAEFGDNVAEVLIFIPEFEEIQREFPIFFIAAPTEPGGYQPVALLGLEKGENLFLDQNVWAARTIPAMFARGPFSIALVEQSQDGKSQVEPMIHIDMDSPRIVKENGQRVFLAQGGNSPYLDHVSRALQIIHQGAQMRETFFGALAKYNLLEPVTIEVGLSDVKSVKITHFSTISAERFANLDAAAVGDLHANGQLIPIILALASLNNVQRLIAIKNAKQAQ